MAALRVERVGRGLKLGVRHDELVPGGLLPAPQGVPLGGVGEADEDAVEGGGLRVVGAWLVPRLRHIMFGLEVLEVQAVDHGGHVQLGVQ